MMVNKPLIRLYFLQERGLLGGSSQLGYVVGITPLFKPWSSAMNGRGPTTRSLGDLPTIGIKFPMILAPCMLNLENPGIFQDAQGGS